MFNSRRQLLKDAYSAQAWKDYVDFLNPVEIEERLLLVAKANRRSGN